VTRQRRGPCARRRRLDTPAAERAFFFAIRLARVSFTFPGTPATRVFSLEGRLAAGMMGIMNSKPKVTVSSLDLDRLETLLAATPDRDFPGKAALQAELDRADVLEPEQMPPDVVTMNSTVRFALQGSDETFSQTIVYPKDADGSADRISILAPVGGALLGMKIGDTIEWPGPGGKPLAVRIVDIVYQPERAGELHR